jgi:bifunctional DNA-binding transcriptional regulator/antitoxin component of YhaV-PrlF toxin-antitoxin module
MLKVVLVLVLTVTSAHADQEAVEKLLDAYSGSIVFNASLNDPNDAKGGGMTNCHGTTIGKRPEGAGCRYVILTAAHCFESKAKMVEGKELRPVTVERVSIRGTITTADRPGITVIPHPDRAKLGTDVAIVSFIGRCNDSIPVVPLRAEVPEKDEFCGIRSDHSKAFRSVQEDGQFKWVANPKVEVKLTGVGEPSGKRDSLYNFEMTGPGNARLVPGDSGSGLVCNVEGRLYLTGVLVTAPHTNVGTSYGVEVGAAMTWARLERLRLLALAPPVQPKRYRIPFGRGH